MSTEINRIVYAKELAAYLETNNNFFWLKARKVVEAANAGSFEIPQLGTPASVHRGEEESLPIKIKVAKDTKKNRYNVQVLG